MIIMIIMIIIIESVMSRPTSGAPAYTEHRHSKCSDLCILTKSIYGKN